MSENLFEGTESDFLCLEKLREQFLSESPGGGADYWEEGKSLSLYDATFGERIGWKWDAVLTESSVQEATFPDNFQLVDWGCGTARASRHFLKQVAKKPGAVCLFDRSEQAMEWSERAVRATGYDRKIFRKISPSDLPTVLVISHVMNELDKRAKKLLLDQIRLAQMVFWVEPGTPAASKGLIQFKEELGNEFRAIAPCPHSSVCGLLRPENAKNWCHHFAPVPSKVFRDGRWRKFSDRLKIDLRALPTSYLVLTRKVLPAPEDSARVIGRPRYYKGYTDALVCTAKSVGLHKYLTRQFAKWEKASRKMPWELRPPSTEQSIL